MDMIISGNGEEMMGEMVFRYKTFSGPIGCFCVLLVLLLAPVFVACTTLESAQDPSLVCDVPAAEEDSSRLSVFFNLKNSDVPHYSLQIDAVEIFNGEFWRPISLQTKEIDTEKLGRMQVSLGNAEFPAGDFQKLRLVLAPEAKFISNGNVSAINLTELESEISFSGPFNLQKNESDSLFLSWDVEASIVGKQLGPLALSLTTSRESLPVTSNQLYLACPDINTVYVVREDRKWVDNSFFVGGRPTYVAVDSDARRIFVLCQEDGDIKVFDLLTKSLTDVIDLPMTFRPIFMTASSDLRNGYVIDDLGHLSVVDLQAGTVIARKKVGQRPKYVAYLPETRTLAVSSSMDSLVYLLDGQKLDVLAQIVVNRGPAGILSKDGFLYIAEEQSNSVTIYDLTIHRKVKSVFVGFSPTRLAGLDDNIYVANTGSGTVSILRTQQNRVIKELALGDQVYEMAASEKEQVVYVGKNNKDDCGGSVSILDLTSNEVIGEIEIGARPLGMAVAGNDTL